MEVDAFLRKVITTEEGKLLLCIRNHTIQWSEEWYNFPEQIPDVVKRVGFLHDNYDIYFTSHLFNAEESTKDNVLPSRTIQADLDDAVDYLVEPSLLVQTSPKRFQGYWFLKYDTTLPILEGISKRLTYAIPNSDHSGWSLGHRLRVPGSLNFKYNNGPHPVEVIADTGKIYAPEDFGLLPHIVPAVAAILDSNFIDNLPTLPDGPFEVIEKYKTKIPQTVYIDYMSKTTAPDRSGALWALACALFEAGAPREEVFWVCKHSPNNKFVLDARYNADRDLAKVIIKAEKHVKIKPVDAKSLIDNIRNTPAANLPGGALMKRRQVLFAVKFAMESTGKLVKVVAGLPYYVPADTGRPIALTAGSEHMRALLHLRFGINSADPEYKYIHDGLIDEGVSLHNEVNESTLSYYDALEKTMYFHTGRRDVLKITHDGVTRTTNGENGLVFPWHDILEPFRPNLMQPYPDDWGDIVFGDLHNTTNMTPLEARALLKAWLIFALFRSAVSSRPILAFFGAPGSSKSTIPHRIYTLLYAKRLAISGVTGAHDFDITSTRLPIYCIDNLDSYVSWIIDKLAQSIGDIDIVKRKLFTDIDMIRLRRQSMIVVTAHNPKFTREDVTSRLLLIALDEISKARLANETKYISAILANREAIWGAIINDVVKVLQTDIPDSSTVKWRIQDFCVLGEWIATALGFQDEFNSGLIALLGSQSDTIIQQEEMLTTALIQLGTTEFMSINQLWNVLLVQMGANGPAFIKAYRSAIKLAQKLAVMRTSLEQIMTIESMSDPISRIKLWRIVAKN